MKESGIKIRDAEKTDAEQIRGLIKYLMKVEGVEDVRGDVEKIMRDRIMPSFNSETSKTFIAEIDKEIIGILLVELKHGLVASMAYTAVNPKYQNHGIGSKLVEKAEKYAKGKNIHIVDVLIHKDNKKSQEFHKKKGYKLFGYLLRKEI